jgi:hypothetical protein
MLPTDVGPLQIDVVGARRAFSVEGSPCRGELGATPADQRPAADGPKEASLREQGVGSSNLPAPTNEINRLQTGALVIAPETAPKT